MELKSIATGSASRRGFTLVELSVVLAIIATVIGMTVASGYSVISSSRLAATNQKMAAIDQALMAYRIANDRIPCPADLMLKPSSTSYGIEWASCATTTPNSADGTTNGMFFTQNIASTAYQVAEGGVPTATLGLPNDFMYDGWGSKIRYAVDVNMTYAGSFSGTQVGALCGGITIMGGGAYPASSYRSNTSTTAYAGAIYALISHGPNQHGGVTANAQVYNAGSNNADELTNCHCTSAGVYWTSSPSYTATYVQTSPYTYNTYALTNSTYNFDDIVTFKERWQMQAPGDTPGTSCPKVYVSDLNNSRVQVFDMNGNFLSTIGSYGSSNSAVQFEEQQGLFMDNASNLWVVDVTNQRTVKVNLSASGTSGTVNSSDFMGCGYSATSGCSGGSGSPHYYGGTGFGGGEFQWPQNIVLDGNGNIWVSDMANQRLQEFSNNMTFLMTVGSQGTANGQFESPYGLAIDKDNNVWVADSQNNRIQEFNSAGSWLRSIGWDASTGFSCETAPNSSSPACSPGSANNSQLNNPRSIAIDAAGNIWVVDNANNRVVEFSTAGAYITSFSTGSSTGPIGIAIDPSGYVWVVLASTSVVLKCTPGGNCTTHAGGSGGFANPTGIAIPQVR